MSREVASLVGLDGLNDGRSASQLRKCLETNSVSRGLELITADGPPLGRGRSARAPTASSDTQSLHSDSLVYKDGQSGF